MSQYGFIIDFGDLKVEQYNHGAGTFVRSYGTPNLTWTPANSNFDTITGLPTTIALGADDIQNPCALAADSGSFYLLDSITCRVLRWMPDTGTLIATFGGRRGIGAGKITPDAVRRNIITLANGSIWVTDNEGGFLSRWTRPGVFVADYSISDWATTAAANAWATFDQITGWTWDTARSCYWALAQGSANCYLLQIDSAGALTGQVIDVTSRVVVTGHGGSGAGREKTRGLIYRNGFLYFWSDTNVYRMDITGPAGDATVYSSASSGRLGPGWINDSGTQLALCLRDETTCVPCARTITLATLTTPESEIYAYGYTVVVGDAVDGHIFEPWDFVVSPYAEDTSTRTAREVSVRSSIRKTSSQTVMARANLRGRTSRTVGALARILRGIQHQVTARARIQEHSTVMDALVEKWVYEDSLGSYSPQISLETNSRGSFQVGQELTVYAGYDNDRVRLIQAIVDEISTNFTTDTEICQFIGREQGTQEIDSKFVTKSWRLSPPDSHVTAHRILFEAAQHVGVTLGALEFPDYPIYGLYQVQQQTLLSIAASLVEPWTQFPHEEYFSQIRNGELGIKRINWTAPPAGGVTLTRRWIETLSRSQQRYLPKPLLTSFTAFQVTGSTYTVSISQNRQRDPNSPLGPITRIEYFKNRAEGDTVKIPTALDGADGSTTSVELIDTETVMEETVCGDFILTRHEDTHITKWDGKNGSGALTSSEGTKLISSSEETFVYVEPTVPIISLPNEEDDTGPCPSSKALLYRQETVKSGIVEQNVKTALGTVTVRQFMEKFRSVTTFQYDAKGRVAVEATTSKEYDPEEGRWKLTEMSTRTHSQTTNGSVRTQLHTFDFDKGDPLLRSADGQQVSGGRPTLANVNSRYAVHTIQARAPALQFISIPGPFGLSILAPVLPTRERFLWTYENPHLGQKECEAVYDLVIEEQLIQNGTYRWDILHFTGPLNPNLHVGEPISIEVEESVFVDYWLERISHEHTKESAITHGEARRLTTEDLP